ncbi:Uncharacterised protein [Streptococcus pneumoniae]|nr:Uncharacterised protein [Streptococcus pneumoniae]
MKNSLKTLNNILKTKKKDASFHNLIVETRVFQKIG